MNNKNHTKEIMEQLSQLRDLLIVIERGGEKTPDILYTLAIEKSQQITTAVQSWHNDAAPEAVTIPAEYDLWIEGTLQEEHNSKSVVEKENDVASDSVVIEVPQLTKCNDTLEEEGDDGYVAPFVEDTPQQELPTDTIQACTAEETSQLHDETCATECCHENEQVVSEEVNDADGDVEYAPQNDDNDDAVMVMDDSVNEEETPLTVDDTAVTEESITADVVEEDSNEIEIIENEESDDVVIFADDEYGEMEDIPVEDDEELQEEEEDFYNRGEPSDNDNEPVTLGEMLGVRQAKELRKALSLNDRFRFRRELFGNKDVEMNNTLNLIDAMTDYAEAREYLLQDLGWSAEDTVVQEFLSLVERHFKQ